MALSRTPLGAPPRLMLSFVVLLLLPAAAVVWLGLQLLRQDKDLAAQQRRERLESGTDRLVVNLEQALSATARHLREPRDAAKIRDDALVAALGRDAIDASPPGALLYVPAASARDVEPSEAFAAGEVAEHQERNYEKAARIFRELARSPNEPVRAGALLRLARNLRKLGRHDAALGAYADLAALDRATAAGLPADLAARRARCALLHELRREEPLQREARALGADLLAPRWRIDRGTLVSYLEQVEQWTGLPAALPAERDAPAAMIEWLWQQRRAGSLAASGRAAARFAGVDVTAIWEPRDGVTIALVAGPHFVRREWIEPALAGAPDLKVSVMPPGGDAAGAAATTTIVRRPGETGLPWTLAATDLRRLDEDGVFAPRRRLLLAGLSLLVLIVAAGGYFVTRAVAREFAVTRLQTDFVAAVSHEFRTPLTSLQQFTSLLADPDEPAADKRRTFYEAQARGIDRLRRLVESLLDFGRMEAGAREYRLEPHDLGTLVRSTVRDFEQHAATNGFTIALRALDRPIVARIDAEAIGRAIWNLLDNAVKYSERGRLIEVAVEHDDGAARIGVRDEGLGIPRDEQAEIFRKFVRGEASRARGIKGTGIGLAMVRHIVEAHGGAVRVQSEPGAGSTFTITLPAEEGV